MKKALALVLALILVLSLTACGGKKDPAPAPSEAPAAEPTASESGAAEAKDLSNPEIVVELNDYDGMMSLGKKMRNFEVAEGSVIQVTGTVSRNTSVPSLTAANSEGAKIGVSIYIDDAPDDKTPAEGETVTAVGVAQKGEYFMEFHAKMENIK